MTDPGEPLDSAGQGVEARIRQYYEECLRAHGSGPEAVNWRGADSQELRFAVLCGVGDFGGRSVHDVGCGLGHLADFLVAQGVSCRYTGSDISGEMIQAASAREIGTGLPMRLEVANLLREDAPWMRADFVVNSGLFTVRHDVSEHLWGEFVRNMIARMFELCEVGIAFNLMTSFVDFREDHLYYVDPGEIVKYCVSDISRKVVVRHDYPLWEYFVYVYR